MIAMRQLPGWKNTTAEGLRNEKTDQNTAVRIFAVSLLPSGVQCDCSEGHRHELHSAVCDMEFR